MMEIGTLASECGAGTAHGGTPGDEAPQRIVHVITRFIRGGADENTLFTCNGQVVRGHEVHLITGEYHPEMIARLNPRIHWHFVPSLVREPSFRDLRCLLDLTRLVRKLRPDIVHTHESKAGVLGRLAARLAGVPLIIHGVHILPFLNVSKVKRVFYLGLERVVAPFTDGFVSVSEEMQRICISEGLGAEDRHSWVPSGMDLFRYREATKLESAAFLPRSMQGGGRTIGLIAGHLEKRKQIAELLTALAPYRDRTDWALLIAGEGPERDSLQNQVESLGLREHVLQLGYREDLSNLLASVDVLVHAAGNEGLPRVVVQAVLAGKPVVTPALPGIGKVVTDRHNGLISPIDDFASLAGNFIALVSDPIQRTAMGAASRAVDLSPWGINSMVSRVADAYRDAALRKFGPTQHANLALPA